MVRVGDDGDIYNIYAGRVASLQKRDKISQADMRRPEASQTGVRHPHKLPLDPFPDDRRRPREAFSDDRDDLEGPPFRAEVERDAGAPIRAEF